MAKHADTIPERLLALLEEQKRSLRSSHLDQYEAISPEVGALIQAWVDNQETEPANAEQTAAVTASLRQLSLMVAGSQQQLSDKLKRIRRHRRSISVYQEGA